MREHTFLKLHIIVNFTFYMSLMLTYGLFFKEVNSPVWLIVYALVVVSVLASAVPDVLINLGVKGIGKGIVRVAIILKGAIFILIFTVMNYDNWRYISIIVALIAVMSIFVEVILGAQLKNVKVTSGEILRRLREDKSETSEKLIKYLIGNFVNLGLFINMQQSNVEIIIFSIICIGVHIYLSEKILSVIKETRNIKNWKIRLIMWLIHLGCMLCIVLKILPIAYLLMGFYWMAVTDIAREKETSVIRSKDENIF